MKIFHKRLLSLMDQLLHFEIFQKFSLYDFFFTTLPVAVEMFLIFNWTVNFLIIFEAVRIKIFSQFSGKAWLFEISKNRVSPRLTLFEHHTRDSIESESLMGLDSRIRRIIFLLLKISVKLYRTPDINVIYAYHCRFKSYFS